MDSSGYQQFFHALVSGFRNRKSADVRDEMRSFGGFVYIESKMLIEFSCNECLHDLDGYMIWLFVSPS